MRVMQEDIHKLSSEYEENIYKWQRERGSLLQRVGELQNSIDKTSKEGQS